MAYIRKLLSLIEIHFKSAFIYRMDFMTSIVITPIMLLGQYFIWRIFFVAQDIIKGYSFTDMINYYVIIMLISHFIYNQVGQRVQQSILYGELNSFLLKPMSVLSQFLSKDIAHRILALLVEVLPIFIIMNIFLDINVIWYNYLFLIIGMILAFGINFFISYLLGLLAFWLYKSESFQWLMFWFMMLLSGQFVPLEFFGTTFFTISKFMPFYYIRYGVAQIYLNKFTVIESLQFLGLQLFWVVLFIILIKIIWKIALKKYGAVGG